MSYVIIPQEVSIKHILKKKCSFSPHSLKDVFIKNKNVRTLGEMIDSRFVKGRPISRSFFVKDSNKFLITNSALQNDFLLSRKRNSSIIALTPDSFTGPTLQKDSILLALNGNVGQSGYIDMEDVENYTISPWMINFKLKEHTKYLFAFLKSDFFREQVEFLTPKGSILSNANEKILDAQIAFPTGKDQEKVIQYVELLVQIILDKEKELIKKNEAIFSTINQELLDNQLNNNFHYTQPKLSDLIKFNRINGAFYSEYFKEREFVIKNYKHGVSNIKDLGFKISRGQNLQVSCIGKSIYSDIPKDGFYTLVIPKNISVYGTVLKNLYLGNAKKLKTLKAGDIIFGAEGFEKGRSVVIFKDENKTITNIHGMTINHSKQNIILSVFIKCFLDYLRQIGIIDLYAVGGNGGSLAQKYWDVIPFPNFPVHQQEHISSLYFKEVSKNTHMTFENVIEEHKKWNKKAGLVQVDISLKQTKTLLESVINKIVRDETINFDFSS